MEPSASGGLHLPVAAEHTFEIRPPRRESRSSGPATAISISITVLEIFAFVAVAIFVPLVRVVVAVWGTLVLALTIYGFPRFRRLQRGLQQSTVLWLTDSEIGYTNSKGVSATSSRAEVAAAYRLITTIGGQSRDLLVFVGGDGRALVSTPLQIWRAEDVDSLTTELGIGVAHRRFVNSESELERIVPGLPNFAAANRRVFVLSYGFATIVAVVVLILVLLLSRH